MKSRRISTVRQFSSSMMLERISRATPMSGSGTDIVAVPMILTSPLPTPLTRLDIFFREASPFCLRHYARYCCRLRKTDLLAPISTSNPLNSVLRSVIASSSSIVCISVFWRPKITKMEETAVCQTSFQINILLKHFLVHLQY